MSARWTQKELDEAAAEAKEMYESLHPEIKQLRERNARLVAALEEAAAFIAYELPVSGKGMVARIDAAIANQQSTEKP